MDKIGMNLPQNDERPGMLVIHSKFLQKSLAVALDRNAGVLFCESEIQGMAAVYAGRTAHARRKAMHEPGQSTEPSGGKNSDFGFSAGRGLHRFILPKAQQRRVAFQTLPIAHKTKSGVPRESLRGTPL